MRAVDRRGYSVQKLSAEIDTALLVPSDCCRRLRRGRQIDSTSLGLDCTPEVHIWPAASRMQTYIVFTWIDSAIVTVLAVVESPRSSSCAVARFIPAAAYWQSVGAG